MYNGEAVAQLPGSTFEFAERDREPYIFREVRDLEAEGEGGKREVPGVSRALGR